MPNPNLQNLKIFGDWLLCEPIKEETETFEGLSKPASYEEKTSKARVVLMGEEIKKPIQVGDILIFNQYAPISFFWKNVEYLILKEEDVLGSCGE